MNAEFALNADPLLNSYTPSLLTFIAMVDQWSRFCSMVAVEKFSCRESKHV